ncbi:hypothetical protein LUZ60_003480 [Juncus effusus]|nr:hypothetical protein LUZ60_003480 [Juncus effusus]
MTQLVFFLLLSFPLYSFARYSQAGNAVSSICSRTHAPALCTSTSTRFAHTYSFSSISAKSVLEMQLRATAKRASAAKSKAAKLAGKYPLSTAIALRACTGLYGNIIDLIGVSSRAIDANDGQTKQMVNLMLMEIRQTVQQCDMAFQKLGVKNPMSRFNNSLFKMSTNCDDLNNIM